MTLSVFHAPSEQIEKTVWTKWDFGGARLDYPKINERTGDADNTV